MHLKFQIMVSKPLLFIRLKLKLSSFLTKSRKTKGQDMEEYVDISWRYRSQAPATEEERFAALLATLPQPSTGDRVDTWLGTQCPDTRDLCDLSQCAGDCGDGEADCSQYACVYT